MNEEILLNKFPKLKERKYYFKEFKINNNNYIDCVYDIEEVKETRIINYIKQNYKNISLYDEEEMKEYFEIYLDDNKIDFCFKYNFKNQKKYKIKIKCIKLITNMDHMFSDCYSLTSLNLSNFNTNNVTNISNMFNGVNKNNCKLICENYRILEKFDENDEKNI